MDLSIIIPCYCSGDNIKKVVNDIDATMNKTDMTYEIIMVNDGSPDNTFEIIEEIAKKRENTYAVDLARNSGQHAAIMAGFNYAKGEVIATCEDDGQTEVSIIPQLIEKLNEGYDVAAPRYVDRGKRSLYRIHDTKNTYSTTKKNSLIKASAFCLNLCSNFSQIISIAKRSLNIKIFSCLHLRKLFCSLAGNSEYNS